MSENEFSQYVRILGKGRKAARSLNFQESHHAMNLILEDKVEDLQLGAFLMLLRVKEESAEELAGFAQAVRNKIQNSSPINPDLDWPSYAGKRQNHPYYILSMLLLAESGIRILSHGAHGHTQNRVYTQDIFESLGLSIAHSTQEARTMLGKTKLCYLPLEKFCPRLNQIMNFRDLFGLRSPVHSFAKIVNPLQSKAIIIPTFHPSYKPIHQEACLLLSEKNIAVFKGESGEAERRPHAILSVDLINAGICNKEQWPALITNTQLDKPKPSISELVEVWRRHNDLGPASQAIIGTCALALKLCGKVNSQKEAIELATSIWIDRSRSII